EYGLDVTVTKKDEAPYETELLIKVDSIFNFTYGIRIQKMEIHADLLDDDSVPTVENSHSYEPVTFFGDGRLGYDVQYMTKNEIITDVLKQYERYMSLVMDSSNQLMTQNVTKDLMAEEEALKEAQAAEVAAEEAQAEADVAAEAGDEAVVTDEDGDDGDGATVVIDHFEAELPVADDAAEAKPDEPKP
nr:hypothetical protein [Neisseriaceae bacterium]